MHDLDASLKRWSFPLYRLFGIAVRMHWLLVVVLAGILIKAGADGGWRLAGWTGVTEAILLASILFHEYAHCWMAVRLGGRAEQVLLWPLGGLACVDFSQRPGNVMRVAGIGPISSLVLATACVVALVAWGAPLRWLHLTPFEHWWPGGFSLEQVFVLHAARLNLILALFNMLVPAWPLDGAKVLFAYLSGRHGAEKAARTVIVLSVPVGLALLILGVAQNEVLTICLGAWVLVEALTLNRLVGVGELESHPAFSHQAPEYDYMPQPEPKPGFFERWRRRRAAKRARDEAALRERAQGQVDAVLEKVSREGMGSLTDSERRVLEEASRRARRE
jgi:Zn-dependent protease